MTSAQVRTATPLDAPTLAQVAAITFPLACPPHTSAEAKRSFIETHLSEASFDRYLADPARLVLIAEDEAGAIGYTMLVFGAPGDADVAAVVTDRPAVELSKCYTLPRTHGSGAASALISATLRAAEEWAGEGGRPSVVWLGVNEENERAQAFYRNHGFARVGRKRFLVGERWEDDFVFAQSLTAADSLAG